MTFKLWQVVAIALTTAGVSFFLGAVFGSGCTPQQRAHDALRKVQK